jgi:hypothetical protein
MTHNYASQHQISFEGDGKEGESSEKVEEKKWDEVLIIPFLSVKNSHFLVSAFLFSFLFISSDFLLFLGGRITPTS